MVDKIKHTFILLYWYIQQNQSLNIKKLDVHNIPRLAWDPNVHGAPGQLPSVPMRYDGTAYLSISMLE